MLKTRQLHIVKESFGGSKDEPWGYYYWEDNEEPHHVYTAFCNRGHATTVCAKDLDVCVKCEACGEQNQDGGEIMIGLSGMVKDVQFDDDEATQFVLRCKKESNYYSFRDEKLLKVLDSLIAKRDNKMIIEADNKPEDDDDFFARLRKEPTVDWNIWHNAFMKAYNQIDFKKCAKTLLCYKAQENHYTCDPDDEVQVENMMNELKSKVNQETVFAIQSWTANNGVFKNDSFSSSSDNVRVTVWSPDVDEENHMPRVHITIFIHDSID